MKMRLDCELPASVSSCQIDDPAGMAHPGAMDAFYSAGLGHPDLPSLVSLSQTNSPWRRAARYGCLPVWRAAAQGKLPPTVPPLPRDWQGLRDRYAAYQTAQRNLRLGTAPSAQPEEVARTHTLAWSASGKWLA